MNDRRDMISGGRFFLWAAFVLTAASARAGTTIEIKDVSPGDAEVAYVTVDRDLNVQVDAVGGEYKSGTGMFAYAWIIDAGTRNLIWSMDEEVTEAVDEAPLLRSYKDEIRLRKGVYELYYFSGSPSRIFYGLEYDNLSDLLKNLGETIERLKEFYNEDTKELDLSESRFSRRFYVRVTGDSEFLHESKRGEGRKPAIAILQPENDAYRRVPFSLTGDAELEIYALGEYWSAKGAMVDWGWIADARGAKPVWEMSRDNTDLAGGADKNRRFRGRLPLPKGSYAAYYVTDDSHTYDGWNSPPPYDPAAWGLQIFPVTADDAAKIVLDTDATPATAVVRLAGVGDNELLSQTFELDKAGPLRIYALGEYDRYGDRMADYAWVATVDGKKKIWVMTGSNTDPAGGASKNRQFDGIVMFEPGDYVVSYASDGSHSYADGWNAAPPLDQKAYGVTIYTVDPALGPRDVVLIDRREPRTRGVLVSVECTGPNAKCEGRFALTSLTRVRVQGMGEGKYPTMSDYGWIVNLGTGDVVWEMTYRKTSHAGGADKNRKVDQVILLDKGEYAVYYVTDGSHSPDQWTGDPPDSPVHWGLTLTEADQEGF